MDVGTPNLKRKSRALASASSSDTNGEDPRTTEVLALIGEHMPLSSSCPLASYLPGFTSLRLMLMKTNKTTREAEVLGTLLESYSSYVSSGIQNAEIAWLLARDCMHLSQQVVPQQQRESLQGQAVSSLAVASVPPQIQGNGINAMALHSAQQLHPAQRYSMNQPFQQGMPPAPSQQQNNTQHMPSQSNTSLNGRFSMN